MSFSLEDILQFFLGLIYTWDFTQNLVCFMGGLPSVRLETWQELDNQMLGNR